MHRLRLWLDRQLIEESWPYRGFSPLNWFILAVILFIAVLFAAETEPLAVARYPLVLQAANLAILTVFALEFALRLFSAGETRGLKGLSARTAYAGRFWLLLDFLAFGPELILLALLYAGADIPLTLAGLRAIRLLRLVKLIHYMPGGRLMSEVLTDVAPQLLATLIAALGLKFSDWPDKLRAAGEEFHAAHRPRRLSQSVLQAVPVLGLSPLRGVRPVSAC